jgi:hypothetical protein
MSVIHRNDGRFRANSGASAMHRGSQAGNGKANDKTDYGDVLGGQTAHPLRKSGSSFRIHGD